MPGSTQPLHLTQRLPRGATGFWDHDPLPQTDPAAFASICYTAARHLGGRIEEITSRGTTPNFHRATISLSADRVSILAHRHLPLLAIAEPHPEPESHADGAATVTFIDHRRTTAALAPESTFHLLSQDELQTDLSRVDLSALSRAELRQVDYWQPQTVGALLFNHWD